MTNLPESAAAPIDPSRLSYDSNGLLPVIAQQHDTGEVLMLAWMSEDTLRETLETGRVVYCSRRRGRWPKGETSGHVQRLVEARADCDLDCVLLRIDQTGVACHTGARSCFFRPLADSPPATSIPNRAAPE